MRPRFAKGDRGCAEVIGKCTGERRAAGKAGGPGDLVDRLVSQGQGHGGTVQPHLPHQGHRRHPGHRLKDPVEVKTRQRRHIGQGIQRQVTHGIVMDMVDDPCQPYFVILCHEASFRSPSLRPKHATNLAELHLRGFKAI